jgi:Cys-rich protein (TIGR01571 family)
VGDVVACGNRRHNNNIPTGKWRDGLCDCFVHGICHPVLWLACCCRPLALGQIMTRTGLTFTGVPVASQDSNSSAPRAASWSAFAVMAGILVVFVVIDYSLALSWFPYQKHMFATSDPYGNLVPPDYSQVPAWAWIARGLNHAVEFAFGIYMLIVLIRTRSHVRRMSGIPEHYCTGGLEDCCCSFWCPCCTTLQIARHTADYSAHPAACCTETGLTAPCNPYDDHHHEPRRPTAAAAHHVV